MVIYLIIFLFFTCFNIYSATNGERAVSDFTHFTSIQTNMFKLFGGTVSNISGYTCIRTAMTWDNLHFDVSNSYAYQQTNDNFTFKLTVEYFDQTNGHATNADPPRLVLHYDSESTGTNEKSINMYHTQRWTNYTFDLDDAYFGNRVSYSGQDADFVLKATMPLYVKRVIITAVSNFPITNKIVFCDLSHTTAIQSNLYLSSGVYGLTNISGYTCQRTPSTNWEYISFNINDYFAFQQTNDGYTFAVTVEYYDKVHTSASEKVLVFDYDSEDHEEVGSECTRIRIPMNNTEEWVSHTFVLEDAYFGNRTYTDNVDFVFKSDSPLAIKYVRVWKLLDSEAQAVKLKLLPPEKAGVGTLNKIFIQALNTVDAVDSDFNGSVNLSVNGSAQFYPDQESITLESGQGTFYVHNSEAETVILQADAPSLSGHSTNLSFVLLYGIDGDSGVNIQFKENNVESELTLKNGDTISANIGGRACRRTPDGVWTSFLLDVNNNFVYQRDIQDGYYYKIQISYYDVYYEGDSTQTEIKCLYDGIENENQESSQITCRQNTQTWKTFTYNLGDVYFGDRHRPDIGTGDFTIKAPVPIYISDISVIKRNYLDLSPGQSLEALTDGVKLEIQKNSVKEEYYLITHRLSKLPESVSVSTVKNYKFINGVEFITVNQNQQKVPHIYLAKPGTLTLEYDLEDITGINVDNLAVFYFDDIKSRWEKLGGSINKEDKTISVNIYKMSKYALLEAKPGQGFFINWTFNPFSPNGDGYMDSSILSVVLPQQAETIRVSIYTIQGELVKQLTKEVTSSGQNFSWDGKNDNGQLVPIGPYVYQVVYDDEHYNGIIVVTK